MLFVLGRLKIKVMMSKITCRLLIGLISITLVNMTFAQELTTQNFVLFDDTCDPACILGLIPGETTSEEVVAILSTHPAVSGWGASTTTTGYEGENYLNDDTFEFVINGSYGFTLFTLSETHTSETGGLVLGSSISVTIVMENGLVSVVWVNNVYQTRIALPYFLNELGKPEQVRLNSEIDPYGTRIILIYLDPPMRIILSHDTEGCSVNKISDFTLSYLSNYSLDISDGLENYPAINNRRQLTVYHSGEHRVPENVWALWLSGQVDQPCLEAYLTLPEDEILPESLESLLDTESES